MHQYSGMWLSNVLVVGGGLQQFMIKLKSTAFLISRKFHLNNKAWKSSMVKLIQLLAQCLPNIDQHCVEHNPPFWYSFHRFVSMHTTSVVLLWKTINGLGSYKYACVSKDNTSINCCKECTRLWRDFYLCWRFCSDDWVTECFERFYRWLWA